MALKVIATAIDTLTILALVRAQIKEKDNSNAAGYWGACMIFTMNIMVIWR